MNTYRSFTYSRVALLLCILMCVFLGACAHTATAPPGPSPAPAPSTAAVALATPTPPLAVAALANRPRPCADASSQAVPPQDASANVAPPADAGSLDIHYDGGIGAIVLAGGATTLAGASQALNRPDVLRELAPGEWLLAADLQIAPGATLRIAGPEVRWLKLRSDDQGFVALKVLGGRLEIAGMCVTSWDPAREHYDENYADGRSFILARDGGQMNIQAAELAYLGYDSGESYGIAWRLAATGQIADSFVSHNYFGLYSFEAPGLVFRGNEVHHNVLYGIDPHTRSQRLTIESNVTHDNGKHGIILADQCSDSVIRDNVSYNNLHHGIVVYQRSDNALIEGNIVYGNAGQGININDSANTTARGNIVYDNRDSGIGVGQRAAQSRLIDNEVRANREDGIVLYGEAAGTLLRDNRLSDNGRSGIYVKSAGQFGVEGNEIFNNSVGVYLNIPNPPEISRATNRIYSNHEADVRGGNDGTAISPTGG